MNKELIAELRRFASGESYGEEPLANLYSEAIDFRAASELFAPNRKLKKRDLNALRVVTKRQGVCLPMKSLRGSGASGRTDSIVGTRRSGDSSRGRFESAGSKASVLLGLVAN